jgi:hypothetical protein
MVSAPKGSVMIASLDVGELTLLLVEAATQTRHPPQMTTGEALDEIKRSAPDIYAAIRVQASVACEYFADCMRNATPQASH